VVKYFSFAIAFPILENFGMTLQEQSKSNAAFSGIENLLDEASSYI
jgi:hypothetical protein